MSWNAGNLVKISLEYRDTRWPGNHFRNILHFRIRVGEAPSGGGVDMINHFLANWMTRILGQMCSSTFIAKAQIADLTNLAEPTDEVLYGSDDYKGALAANEEDVPQACAVVVRKAYQRGRSGIGRFFFGPLCARFTDSGFVVADPVGTGDLQDVLDALGDEWTYTGGVIFRPVIVSAHATTAASNNDVRRNTIAPLTCYLKSRRLGKGE